MTKGLKVCKTLRLLALDGACSRQAHQRTESTSRRLPLRATPSSTKIQRNCDDFQPVCRSRRLVLKRTELARPDAA